MVIGDRVKFKLNDKWTEGEIVNIYAIPKDWCLFDIELDNGEIIRGFDSREVFGV